MGSDTLLTDRKWNDIGPTTTQVSVFNRERLLVVTNNTHPSPQGPDPQTGHRTVTGFNHGHPTPTGPLVSPWGPAPRPQTGTSIRDTRTTVYRGTEDPSLHPF